MRFIFFCPDCGFTGSDEQDKMNNPSRCPECGNTLNYTGVTQDEWRLKSKDEKSLLKDSWKRLNEDIQNRHKNHMLTSGYNFEGYEIMSYNGIVSGEVVMGTGFLSELSASINDFFGSTSEEFSNKMKKAKEIAISKMITVSVSKGGNAIIGVDFDYTTFGNNMIAVSANGTSVEIVKQGK